MRSCIVPPYLIAQIAQTHERFREGLEVDSRLRSARRAGPEAAPAAAAAWTVHTAGNTEDLPGTPVRAAGQPESGDPAVDEAAAGVTASLALFSEVFGRSSYDGTGAPVSLTVHFGEAYANAFWDGTQLVFGDGDGEIFDRMTKPIDVLAHELTHAVTQHTADLVYSGQSGALNESMSDVFAACVKQRVLGQTADQADWLIGAELFLPGVNARALRDMAAPGTAYNDPVLGRDPQPGQMSDYIDTVDDNGGVHLNSGIPNRAFQLAATAIGGHSWEGAGQIWYAALTGDQVTSRSDFATFAAATVAAAGEHADAVTRAWEGVGVRPGEAGAVPATESAPASSPTLVVVRRSGGFAGLTQDGAVDVAGADARAAEVRGLCERIDLRSVRGGRPMPDMFVYTFEVYGAPAVTVPEQHLTNDLRQLARLVLSDDR